MEHLKHSSIAEKKAHEYVDRILNGEPIASILAGLSPVLRIALFRAAYPRLIPKNALHLSASTVENQWRIDPKMNPDQLREAIAYRSLVIECLRLREHDQQSQQNNNKPTHQETLHLLTTAYNRICMSRRYTLRDDMLIAGRVGEYIDEGGKVTSWELVDDNVGKHFDAHGISKTHELTNLLDILTHGIDKSRPFYSAPFDIPADEKYVLGAGLGTSGGTAYKDGLAILVSRYDGSLTTDGISAVFINDVFGGLIPILRQAFPQYRFYPLSEQKRILETEARQNAR